jgi:phage portal protein BeeE
MGMSSTDLEILKTAIQNLRMLCNVYGAPSELFNDPANKTHANQKAALKSFYENSVLPLDRRVLSKYNSTVVKDWSVRDNKNYTVVQDLQHIGALQEDQDKKAARSEKITNSIIKVVAQTKQGLSPDAAANIIAHAHGLPIDEAKKFVSLLNTNQNSNE